MTTRDPGKWNSLLEHIAKGHNSTSYRPEINKQLVQAVDTIVQLKYSNTYAAIVGSVAYGVYNDDTTMEW